VKTVNIYNYKVDVNKILITQYKPSYDFLLWRFGNDKFDIPKLSENTMIINCTITRHVYCGYIIQFAFFQKFQDVSNSDFEPILLNGPNIFIPLHCLKAQYFCLKICPSLCNWRQ